MTNRLEAMPTTMASESPEVEPGRTVLAKSEWRLLWLYGLLACLSLPVYLFYAFVIPQTPGRLARASTSLIPELPVWSAAVSLPVPVPQDSYLVAILLIVFAVLGFAGYGAAIYLSWNRRANAYLCATVVTAAIIFFLISTWSLPNSSTDIYNYMMRGRTAAVYHSNPYYVAADEFPEDPIYPFASHNYTSTPGDRPPAWLLINIFLASIAGDDPVTNLLVYRFALFGFSVANLAFIVMILRRLNSRHVLAGVVLYSWNPIVVMFGSSKTDSVMVFFLLSAILLLLMERKKIAVVLMGLSVLVKLITLPFVAVYLLRSLRLKQWRQFAVDTVLLGLTASALYLPFLEDPRLFLRLVDLLGTGGASAGGPAIVSTLLKAVFVLVIATVGLRADGDNRQLLRQGAVVVLVFSILLTRVSLSWYLLTLIGLVSLVLDGRLAVMTLALSFLSFLMNTWQSAFGGGFDAPHLFDIPGFLVYVGLAAAVASAIWWRSVHPERAKQNASSGLA
ncbi:MAG TPA: hypothetical protein VF177_07330 [Anaerolineae bacterium]